MAPFLGIAKAVSISFAVPPQIRHQEMTSTHHVSLLQPSENSITQIRNPKKDRPATSTPLHASSADTTADSPGAPQFGLNEIAPSPSSLSDLITLLGAGPITDLIHLSANSDGERGVYLSRPVDVGNVVLRVPLSSCITDTSPPQWFSTTGSDCAACLAATMLDLRLHGTGNFPANVGEGLSLWLSMLPDESLLRASLPVHWDDETIANAKCTALEIAADSSFFARAEAASNLVQQLQMNNIAFEEDDLTSMAHDALDLVQTRSCQVVGVDGAQWGDPLHVIAPIFDFINHGSSVSVDGSANVDYVLEDDVRGELMLVVRATRNIDKLEEILIDYGEHAKPSWHCLNNYGFVPKYDANETNGDAQDNVAEIFIAGTRYEVGPSFVPVEMVESAAIAIAEEQRSALDNASVSGTVLEYDDLEPDAASLLTADVAIPIAKRLSEVAFQLILEPGVVDQEPDYGEEDDGLAAEDLLSARLAASLRWSQFEVLLSCASAMREYAAQDVE